MTVQEDQSNQSDGLSTNTAGAFISIRHKLKASFNTSEGHCYLDSGASHHMFLKREYFHEYRPQKTQISLADDNYIESAGEGFVLIKAKKNNPIKLKALNVPKLAHTLISLGCLYERGCDIVRTSDKNFDSSNKGDVILSGSIKGDVWSTNVVVTQEGQAPLTSATLATTTDVETLHRAAGHPNLEVLRKIFPHIPSLLFHCNSCSLVKSHRLPFPSELPKATRPLECIYMDLSGWINPPSSGGKEYYFKITNYYSCYRHIYLLSKKSAALSFFTQFHQVVTTYHNSTIKTVVFDGGGEFNSNQFLNFLKEKGITAQVAVTYTPQKNLVAEQGNRSTSEKIRALLKQASLPSEYWGEAVCTAVLLENKNK